jgi:hypothetical protein
MPELRRVVLFRANHARNRTHQNASQSSCGQAHGAGRRIRGRGCLTLRSSGPTPACGNWPPFHSGPIAACRCGPLNSNVRRRRAKSHCGVAMKLPDSHGAYSEKKSSQEAPCVGTSRRCSTLNHPQHNLKSEMRRFSSSVRSVDSTSLRRSMPRLSIRLYKKLLRRHALSSRHLSPAQNQKTEKSRQCVLMPSRLQGLARVNKGTKHCGNATKNSGV